jgi:hypothetical protein
MGINGQRYAPATLCPGERIPGTHCTGSLVGPSAGLDTEARGKITFASAGDRTSIARGSHKTCCKNSPKYSRSPPFFDPFMPWIPLFTPLFDFRHNDSLFRHFRSVTPHAPKPAEITASLRVQSRSSAELSLYCSGFKTGQTFETV